MKLSRFFFLAFTFWTLGWSLDRLVLKRDPMDSAIMCVALAIMFAGARIAEALEAEAVEILIEEDTEEGEKDGKEED